MKISDLCDKEMLENYRVNLRPLNSFKKKYIAEDNSEFIDEGYIISIWNQGIWVKKNKTDSKVFPIYMIDFSKILDLEIIK